MALYASVIGDVVPSSANVVSASIVKAASFSFSANVVRDSRVDGGVSVSTTGVISVSVVDVAALVVDADAESVSSSTTTVVSSSISTLADLVVSGIAGVISFSRIVVLF